MNIECKTQRNSVRQKTAKMVANDDFQPCECSLCGAEINAAHQSNNPYPLGSEGDKCCHICNVTQVIPARLGLNPDETEDLVRDLLPLVLERLRGQEERLKALKDARKHAA